MSSGEGSSKFSRRPLSIRCHARGICLLTEAMKAPEKACRFSATSGPRASGEHGQQLLDLAGAAPMCSLGTPVAGRRAQNPCATRRYRFCSSIDSGPFGLDGTIGTKGRLTVSDTQKRGSVSSAQAQTVSIHRGQHRRSNQHVSSARGGIAGDGRRMIQEECRLFLLRLAVSTKRWLTRSSS